VEDLHEENRNLKDLNMKLQAENTRILKERAALANELEQVKANFKQHLQSKHTAGGNSGSGGNLAELERELAETKTALEQKNEEVEQIRKDMEKRVGDTKQFKDLMSLVKKKSDEIKQLREQVNAAGVAKKAADVDDGCIELEEEDSD